MSERPTKGERLYGRFCLRCGFVVHGLFPRCPFPITRRCGLCQIDGYPLDPDEQEAVDRVADPTSSDPNGADVGGGGESKGGQGAVAPSSEPAVSAKPIATAADVSSEGKRLDELRQLAEVALEGAGHRQVPCPICDLARAAQDAASEVERLREALRKLLASLPAKTGDWERIEAIREARLALADDATL